MAVGRLRIETHRNLWNHGTIESCDDVLRRLGLFQSVYKLGRNRCKFLSFHLLVSTSVDLGCNPHFFSFALIAPPVLCLCEGRL